MLSHQWLIHAVVALLTAWILMYNFCPQGLFKLLVFGLIGLLIVGCIDFLHRIMAYLLPFELAALIVSSLLNSFMLFCCFGWLFDYDYHAMVTLLKSRLGYDSAKP
ncbi:hypothetical protein [Herpetosiphon giganteus]|uniref:hypothetical protein n=1 Tax=Herpetosiphon giganteus TaxID=2029754 RepID=UPI00195DD428|nr:hypothetical protein [Herpetosiphon giganteus]MBM7842356.1 CBS domain containing-hemolysin-like protein [Herpetosiphon giganteus]